jgi:hypothetical protein
VEGAGVGEVLPDVFERLALEVVGLEVMQAQLQLPLAFIPNGVEALEEARHRALDARGTEADFPC